MKYNSAGQPVEASSGPVPRLLQAIVIGCLPGGCGVADAQVNTEQDEALVTVSPVVERQVVAKASFVATVQPLRRSVVGSAVDGRVVEFLAGGQDTDTKITRVSQGQSMAKLRTKTIEIELAAARAELELREHAHAELKNGSRPEEKVQALAKQLSAKAHMDYARATRTVRETGAISFLPV